MRNIELKAHCRGLDAARRIAERLGARLQGTERQRDTYFACTAGRLKLRERWLDRQTSGELIAYRRADAYRPRPCDYLLVPVREARPLRDVLARALGVSVQVDKRRTVYLYANVRIHLDRVKALGSFIEFEAVLSGGPGSGCGPRESRARLRRLIAAFGIREGDIVPQSYAELVRARRRRRFRRRPRRTPTAFKPKTSATRCTSPLVPPTRAQFPTAPLARRNAHSCKKSNLLTQCSQPNIR